MNLFFWACALLVALSVTGTISLILSLFIVNCLGQPVLTTINNRLNSQRLLLALQAAAACLFIGFLAWILLTLPLFDACTFRIFAKFTEGPFRTYFGDFGNKQFDWYIAIAFFGIIGAKGALLGWELLRMLKSGPVRLIRGRFLPRINANFMS